LLKLVSPERHFKDEGAFARRGQFYDVAQPGGICHYRPLRAAHLLASLEMIRDKVQAAIRNGLTLSSCTGETGFRNAPLGETKRVIHDQLTTAVANLTAEGRGRHIVKSLRAGLLALLKASWLPG